MTSPRGNVRLAGSVISTDKELVDLYRGQLRRYGFSSEALFYKSGLQHRTKLRAIVAAAKKISGLASKSVLDVGCGFGAMVEIIPPCAYLGIDLVPEFIEHATSRYPSHRFEFTSIDEMEPRSFDVCLLAGVLSSVPNGKAMLVSSLNVAREAVVFDVTMEERLPPDYPDLNRWKFPEVSALLSKAGYRVAGLIDQQRSWVVFRAIRMG